MHSALFSVLQLSLSTLGLAASLPNVVLPRQGSGTLKYGRCNDFGDIVLKDTDSFHLIVGTNIAGFDFGCATDGTCTTSKAYPPLSSLGGADG